jgi:hypothetical protein
LARASIQATARGLDLLAAVVEGERRDRVPAVQHVGLDGQGLEPLERRRALQLG